MGFRDILEAGDHETWEKKESILEMQHFSSLEEEEKKRKKEAKSKGIPLRRQEKKARCVMEFGGKSGQILTFVSYAQKAEKSDLGFRGYIGSLFVHCFKNCFGVICCECCRGRETNEEIQKNKSKAYS